MRRRYRTTQRVHSQSEAAAIVRGVAVWLPLPRAPLSPASPVAGDRGASFCSGARVAKIPPHVVCRRIRCPSWILNRPEDSVFPTTSGRTGCLIAALTRETAAPSSGGRACPGLPARLADDCRRGNGHRGFGGGCRRANGCWTSPAPAGLADACRARPHRRPRECLPGSHAPAGLDRTSRPRRYCRPRTASAGWPARACWRPERPPRTGRGRADGCRASLAPAGPAAAANFGRTCRPGLRFSD